MWRGVRGGQNVNITFTPDYKFTQIIQLPAEVGELGEQSRYLIINPLNFSVWSMKVVENNVGSSPTILNTYILDTFETMQYYALLGDEMALWLSQKLGSSVKMRCNWNAEQMSRVRLPSAAWRPRLRIEYYLLRFCVRQSNTFLHSDIRLQLCKI